MDGGARQWPLWYAPVGVGVVLVLAATIEQRSPRFFGLRRMTITRGRAALWIFLGSLLAGVAGGVYELVFDDHGRVWIFSDRPHGTQAVVVGCAP
jgi:hypothetical protein